MDAPGHRKTLSPHVTKQVRRPQGSTIPFPLKKHYDRINFSFEGVLSGDIPEEVDFDLPDGADDEGEVSRGFPMDGAVDPEAGGKPPEAITHDYKIDTLGRRYPVDIYGDRVIPNNRRPQGVPKDIWGRLNEGDKQSLVEATREYEERKNAPSSSSALPAIPEGDDELQPLATMIGNVFVTTIDDQCETFVSE